MQDHFDDVAREVSSEGAATFKYSICTLVTRAAEYAGLLKNFQERGFAANDCEFLFIDNSGENHFDAFGAYNHFLRIARGEYVILCHQDIDLIDDGRKELDDLLRELTQLDPQWGVCGNVGVKEDGRFVHRITDPYGPNRSKGGPFPVKVVSLDEQFMVVRHDRNLALSHDLHGFHWYAADLCMVASMLGSSVYVINFHLYHKSTGNIDAVFHACRKAFTRKYGYFFRPRWHEVVSGWSAYLSPSRTGHLYARAKRILANRILPSR